MDEQGSLIPHPHGEQPALSEPPPPLDVPQSFAPATSYQVRDELETLIRRDLLGPWDGEHEELRSSSSGPSERYLVGRLGPKPAPGAQKAAGATLDLEVEVQGDTSEPELPEVLTPQSLGKLWAASMGMSFAVPASTDVLAVTASWGQYRKQERAGEDGKTRRVWVREPVTRTIEVRLDGAAAGPIPLTGADPAAPGVLLAVQVRQRGARRVVQLVLVNAQREPDSATDTAWLFQSKLAVTAPDGHAAAFCPIDDPADDIHGVSDDREETHLRLLYRSRRRYAAGHNVAVHPHLRDGERNAVKLETEWIPAYDVAATVAPHGEESGLAGLELAMDTLATADPAALRAGLMPLVDGYLAWLSRKDSELAALPPPLRPAAEAAVFTARRAADRVRAGIDLLADPAADRHDQALAAFRFANRAMALQRRHTEIGRLREAEHLAYPEAAARIGARGAAAASWRPFQLAFVLLNLPSLTDPGHPERAADHSAIVDLLFFPTGGGKTEAYLGLTAYTFAIRRLQGVVGGYSGAAGTAVLMRYTLRLLTAQQFQRAAALICAAELLRREDTPTWGAEPFRIGLWVGGGVSPNWYPEAAEQIAEAREAGHGQRTNVLQTLACPWCGTKLEPHRDLHPDDDLRRVLLWCPNGEGAGACPFSRTRGGEGLPILTVDEEIYRLAPSLVVATVDKLAQLPWNGYAGILFGRVRQRCPRHGYRHDDLDARTACTGRHNRKGRLPAVVSEPVGRLRPPDLIIQDELHLISGALGTTVGLFEAAVDQLCTWSPGTRDTGPKIVASTATTKRAAEQVLGVFGRGLAVFPPPVLDAGDTFFSVQAPLSKDQPGRRYLGICAHGVRLKAAEIRLAEILLLAGQTLFDRYGQPAEPYLTTVSYFNSTRELAGMRRYLDDDVANRVRWHGHRKGLSDRLVLATRLLTVQELTSRISSADISQVLKRLEVGFEPELDTSERKRAVAAEFRRAHKEKGSLHALARRYGDRQRDGRDPVDAVLATSMLQVGVDVPRFGLMVVTGQPKNTAEYIQASSRVGREAARPGLVVTLYNWTRPRDLAHFEDFEYYHATFYRQVEALSVTPYTRRALDRGTAATFVAAVRHRADSRESFSRNLDAHDVPLSGPQVRDVVDRLLARAEAIGGDRARGYLAERIGRVTDRWNEAKTGAARLAYAPGRARDEQVTSLLEKATGGRWGDLTVGMSMRETEPEINLLLAGGGEIFNPTYGAPEWSFSAEVAGGDTSEDDLPDGDEVGEPDGGR